MTRKCTSARLSRRAHVRAVVTSASNCLSRSGVESAFVFEKSSSIRCEDKSQCSNRDEPTDYRHPDEGGEPLCLRNAFRYFLLHGDQHTHQCTT
jgi:hypothetical protein